MNSIFCTKSQMIAIAGFFVLIGFACKSPDTATQATEYEKAKELPTDLVIDAQEFSASSKGFSLSDDKKSMVSSTEDKEWLEFELNVQQAGRYQVLVRAVGPNEGTATVWIEDYIDNKDNRTYNITGNMVLNGQDKSGGAQNVSKDGSPLNVGLHKMRLHKEGAGLSIENLQFKFMLAHQITPKEQKQNMQGENWKLAWSDEFEGTGLPDQGKWTYDVGDWGWGNNELQYYTVEREENARLEGGNLIIEARKNDMGHAWTSARLTTRGKVSFVHGKIEFRAKVPPNKGCWAAGWTLGDEYRDEMSWPYCGEIDILESVGFEMNDETGDGQAHASVHCGAYYFKLGNQPTADLPVKNMHEEFHTYSVVWTPEKIAGYVDDKQYFEYSDTRSELAWPFNKGQNIILNLAMGGGWGGAQGMDESISSQKFIIDYVRVYELE